eukprot:15011084-Alexandrium_andersonii.AAC.1
MAQGVKQNKHRLSRPANSRREPRPSRQTCEILRVGVASRRDCRARARPRHRECATLVASCLRDRGIHYWIARVVHATVGDEFREVIHEVLRASLKTPRMNPHGPGWCCGVAVRTFAISATARRWRRAGVAGRSNCGCSCRWRKAGPRK